VVTFAIFLSVQSEDADAYSVGVVKDALAMRSGGQIAIRSWSQKHLSRLGDGVSIALLKILEESDLKNFERVRDLLPIVRDSFSQPQFISIEADKKPKVTLLLLDHLRQNIADAQVQSDILQTVEFVESKAAEPASSSSVSRQRHALLPL
jgi:hypothetical protein